MSTTTNVFVLLGVKLPRPPYVSRTVRTGMCDHFTPESIYPDDKFCKECGKALWETIERPLYNEDNMNWGRFVVNDGYKDEGEYFVGLEIARLTSFYRCEQKFLPPDPGAQLTTFEELRELLGPHKLFDENLFGTWVVLYWS